MNNNPGMNNFYGDDGHDLMANSPGMYGGHGNFSNSRQQSQSQPVDMNSHTGALNPNAKSFSYGFGNDQAGQNQSSQPYGNNSNTYQSPRMQIQQQSGNEFGYTPRGMNSNFSNPINNQMNNPGFTNDNSAAHLSGGYNSQNPSSQHIQSNHYIGNPGFNHHNINQYNNNNPHFHQNHHSHNNPGSYHGQGTNNSNNGVNPNQYGKNQYNNNQYGSNQYNNQYASNLPNHQSSYHSQQQQNQINNNGPSSQHVHNNSRNPQSNQHVQHNNFDSTFGNEAVSAEAIVASNIYIPAKPNPIHMHILQLLIPDINIDLLLQPYPTNSLNNSPSNALNINPNVGLNPNNLQATPSSPVPTNAANTNFNTRHSSTGLKTRQQPISFQPDLQSICRLFWVMSISLFITVCDDRQSIDSSLDRIYGIT